MTFQWIAKDFVFCVLSELCAKVQGSGVECAFFVVRDFCDCPVKCY